MTKTTIENIVKRVHAYVNLVQRQVVYSVTILKLKIECYKYTYKKNILQLKKK